MINGDFLSYSGLTVFPTLCLNST